MQKHAIDFISKLTGEPFGLFAIAMFLMSIDNSRFNEAPRFKQTGYLYWIFLFIASRGGVSACLRIALAMAGRFD